MKKLKFGLLLTAALSLCCPWAPIRAENIVGPPNAIFCNKNANTAIVTVGTTQVIAGTTGQTINICGYAFSGATAGGTFQLVYGTGASCTSPTSLTALFTPAQGVSMQDHFGYAWASSQQGQSVCIVVTGAGSVSIAVYYSQF